MESSKDISGKKILIIGNGFDLAHNLPTRYVDFLEYSKAIIIIMKGSYNNSPWSDYKEHVIDTMLKRREISEADLTLLDRIKYIYGWECNGENKPVELKNPSHREMIRMCKDLNNNPWYEYFWNIYKNGILKGRNWIDFENEIRDVIMWMDSPEHNLTPQSTYGELYPFYMNLDQNNKLRIFFQEMGRRYGDGELKEKPLRDFSELMYSDLRKLTEALEIYLSGFVDHMPAKPIDKIQKLHPDYILSFNYTNTYQRIYDPDNRCSYCYIHGKCRDNFEGDNCNLVLGIDEYLDENERNVRNNYPIFKKFIQRIRYNDSSIYMEWCNQMDKAFKSGGHPSEVWAFGHSLDRTDKDVLRRFLKPQYTMVHIFSNENNENDIGRLATNLIHLIDEDSLIQKSGAYPKRLDFLP